MAEGMRGRPIGTSRLLALIVFIAAALAAGLIGSVAASAGLPTWYAGLSKPAFTPPQDLIPLIRSVLYVLMGIGAWLVWLQSGSVARNSALAAFFVQLALNAGWSWAFFGARSTGLGLVVIIALLASVVWMSLSSLAVSRTAAIVFLPYLLWTGFATVLNAAIFMLN